MIPAMKIAVPIVGPSPQQVQEQLKKAVRIADFLEFRVDLWDEPLVSDVAWGLRQPVMVTYRLTEEGGKGTNDIEKRMEIFTEAVAAGVDYIDVEGMHHHSIFDAIRRGKHTKRIASYHNFQETPQDLTAIHQKLAGTNPDVIKIVTRANSIHDAVRPLELVKSSVIPTVAFCMGPQGLYSRVLTCEFGAPWTFGALDRTQQSAPDQPTVEELRETEQLLGLDQVHGLVGKTVCLRDRIPERNDFVLVTKWTEDLEQKYNATHTGFGRRYLDLEPDFPDAMYETFKPANMTPENIGMAYKMQAEKLKNFRTKIANLRFMCTLE